MMPLGEISSKRRGGPKEYYTGNDAQPELLVVAQSVC
jgi:hypothetical protein